MRDEVGERDCEGVWEGGVDPLFVWVFFLQDNHHG